MIGREIEGFRKTSRFIVKSHRCKGYFTCRITRRAFEGQGLWFILVCVPG